MIYYPRLDWKPEWLKTVIWNNQKNEIDKYVNYIGNRLFVFDPGWNFDIDTIEPLQYGEYNKIY